MSACFGSFVLVFWEWADFSVVRFGALEGEFDVFEPPISARHWVRMLGCLSVARELWDHVGAGGRGSIPAYI